jgi:hypothetical protein
MKRYRTGPRGDDKRCWTAEGVVREGGDVRFAHVELVIRIGIARDNRASVELSAAEARELLDDLAGALEDAERRAEELRMQAALR